MSTFHLHSIKPTKDENNNNILMVIHSLQNNKFAGGRTYTRLLAIQRYCIQFGDNVDLLQNIRWKEANDNNRTYLSAFALEHWRRKLKSESFFCFFHFEMSIFIISTMVWLFWRQDGFCLRSWISFNWNGEQKEHAEHWTIELSDCLATGAKSLLSSLT